MNALEKALALALKAHAGQKDKAGQPYILHPLRVMLQMEDTQTKIVALLHDVLEDSNITLQELKQAGFDPQILEAVDCLTRREQEDYFTYLERVAQNKLALSVKIADLKDNLDVTRLKEITPADQQRLNKYLKALTFLQDH